MPTLGSSGRRRAPQPQGELHSALVGEDGFRRSNAECRLTCVRPSPAALVPRHRGPATLYKSRVDNDLGNFNRGAEEWYASCFPQGRAAGLGGMIPERSRTGGRVRLVIAPRLATRHCTVPCSQRQASGAPAKVRPRRLAPVRFRTSIAEGRRVGYRPAGEWRGGELRMECRVPSAQCPVPMSDSR